MTSPSSNVLDALVVGGGAAGIGTSLAFIAVRELTHGLIERGQIGETFRRWPVQQRFLTPSFTGNGFGATDLNSIHPQTSPAFSLGIDYPDGAQYAQYLRGIVRHFDVPVLLDTEVLSVETCPEGFVSQTTRGPVISRNLVWAGGEFHAPSMARFSGGSSMDHSSTPDAWSRRLGRLVIVGGYESGIDLACHHIEQGAVVTVVDPEHPWDAGSGSDPSFRLSPRTRQRLAEALTTGKLTLLDTGNVVRVRPIPSGSFEVSIAGSGTVTSDSRPILATGFGSGLGPVSRFFAQRSDGWPELDDNDESTVTPGLFLSGPSVRHGRLKFCFVYKFRQRFAHVAGVIGRRLDKDCTGLEEWREAGMLTDDLSCCGVECVC